MTSGMGVVNATWRPSTDKTPQDINIQSCSASIFCDNGYVMVCEQLIVQRCVYTILLIDKGMSISWIEWRMGVGINVLQENNM